MMDFIRRVLGLVRAQTSPIAIRRNDSGSRVVQMQRALVALGYALPRFGVDGDQPNGGAGDETLAAMRLFLEQHGHDVDDHRYDSVTAAEIDMLLAVAGRVPVVAPTSSQVIDRIAQAAIAGRHLDMGPRPWTEVTAIMFHHTACWLSSSTDIARCDAVGAHRVIYPDGRRLKLHPLNRRIVHGHGGNTRCIGYEIDGNFRGVESDDNTRWKPGGPAAVLGEAQIEAVKQQAREDVAEVLAHGGRVVFALVHRQASRDRQGDPGSAIARQIVLPLAAELGLSIAAPGWVFPDANGGLPWPYEWTDDDETRRKYRY
jgi:peptidoglycan hydrolase-like protein with peptidoglycan-binding domain